MFNWLKKLFGFGKPALDPEIYGGAGGRVPIPPYEVVQERRRMRAGMLGVHPLPGPIPPPPPAPPRSSAPDIRERTYTGRDDSITSDLALLALLSSRREPDLDRPSAWPPLDPIVSGKGGDFGGGGASGGWEAPAPSPSPDYGSSDSSSSDSCSSSSD